MGIVRTIIDQPEEFPPLVQMAWAAHKAKRLPKEPNLAFCYDMLNRVGRRYIRLSSFDLQTRHLNRPE